MSNKVLIEIFNLGIKEKKKDAVCFKLPELSKIAVVATKNKYAAAPIILSKYKAIYTNKTTTRYYVNNKSATCIPTRFNDKIKTKIMNTRKIHKKIIDKLVVNKKINNINLLIKKKITSNIKFNFWWEVN